MPILLRAKQQPAGLIAYPACGEAVLFESSRPQIKIPSTRKCTGDFMRPGGFEPLAFRVGAERSIQLSYDRTSSEWIQYKVV